MNWYNCQGDKEEVIELKNDYRSKINAVVKIFISNLCFGLIVIAVVIVGRNYFGDSFLKQYQAETFSSLALTSLVFSLVSYPHLLHISKVTRIDDKNEMKDRIKYGLEAIGWNQIETETDKEIYEMSWMFGLWKEIIQIKYTDSEVFFTGPKRDLEVISKIAKFPYEIFPLLNVKSATLE